MPISGADAARIVPADIKYIGDLLGCYVLASREQQTEGPRVFGCRSRSISARLAVLEAPVPGVAGEMVGLKLDTLGLLKARIQRVTADGFVAELLLDEAERTQAAARIDWLKRHHAHAAAERRQAKRWLPRVSRSNVLLTGHRKLVCLVIDVSSTGAAISADASVKLGEPLAVGGLLAHVVRQVEYGFAVEFAVPQAPDTVEAALAPPSPERAEAMMALLDKALAVTAA